MESVVEAGGRKKLVVWEGMAWFRVAKLEGCLWHCCHRMYAQQRIVMKINPVLVEFQIGPVFDGDSV